MSDPLVKIETCIDVVHLAAEIDHMVLRPVRKKCGRPLFSRETMVRILILKRIYKMSDEQIKYQLLDRISFKRFCLTCPPYTINIPDLTTLWTFENRIGEVGAKAIFDGVTSQLMKKVFIARGG